MAQLNELELQNLRHLIYSHETSYQKSAQDAMKTKQKLLSFLG